MNDGMSEPGEADDDNDNSLIEQVNNSFVHDEDNFKSNANVLGGDMARKWIEMNKGSISQETNNAHDIAKSELHALEADAARRQREMNAFAAMANGAMDEEYPSSPVNNNKQTALEADATRKKRIDDFGSKSGMKELPAHIHVETTGTFVNEKKESSSVPNRNINAALASLDNATTNGAKVEKVEFKQVKGSCQVKQRTPRFSETYSECIRIAKPFFFGHKMPPVLAKEMDRQHSLTSHLIGNGLDSDVSLHSNDSIDRNLESVFTVFGQYPLSGNPTVHRDAATDGKLKRIRRYVTLFEPVWGDSHRLVREDRIYGFQDDKDALDDQTNSEENKEHVKVDEGCQPLHNKREGQPLNGSNDDPVQKSNGIEKIKDASNEDKREQSSLFLQYARGEINSYDNTFIGGKSFLHSVPEGVPVDSSTFRQLPESNGYGSFEGSELKKQVGLNDNLSKALESLAINTGVGTSLTAADAGAAAIEAAKEIHVTVKDGRPLTNLEMAGGQVPIYGCDDSPLPVPNDLGIYETKEDQIQSMRQSQAQEMISSGAVPNIFGPVVCPSSCLGPNDSQTWSSHTSRNDRSRSKLILGSMNSIRQLSESRFSTPLSHLRGFSNAESVVPNVEDKSGLPSPLPPPPNGTKTPQTTHRSRGHGSRETVVSFGQLPTISDSSIQRTAKMSDDHRKTDNSDRRIGWWNIENDFGLKPKRSSSKYDDASSSLQLPPARDGMRDDFSWVTYPSQEKLRSENRSFAELNTAVDTIKHLPYLSDRDPLLRHVQIDTQVVSFPSVGEIEPFFCSLSIWHVETNVSDNDAPDINWSKSGRITESLYFDVVSDRGVEESCRAALWPYLDKMESPETPLSCDEDLLSSSMLRGTRCGVFPLHSRYDMTNLYAVLIVHRTIPEESEPDVYVNPPKPKIDEKSNQFKNAKPDVAKLRIKAGKAADRFGHILTPFTFGVAPLVQILGSTPPQIPTSRAAQIPLFKMVSGDSEKHIINHILAVTHQRYGKKLLVYLMLLLQWVTNTILFQLKVVKQILLNWQMMALRC